MSGVELFAIGSTAITAADALAVASAGIGAMSAISQAQGQAAMAKHNAAVAERDATAARQQAEFEETRHRENTKRFLSAQRAAIGKSGVELAGSPLLVMAETAEDAELDAQAILYSGSVAAARNRSQAALERLRGRSARTAGAYGAGGSLLTGASKLADKR